MYQNQSPVRLSINVRFGPLDALLVLLWSSATAAAAKNSVWQDRPNPTPSYTMWLTAATDIHDGVDGALAGDEIIVTYGVCATGGRAVYGTMTSQVAANKPLTLRSVPALNQSHETLPTDEG